MSPAPRKLHPTKDDFTKFDTLLPPGHTDEDKTSFHDTLNTLYRRANLDALFLALQEARDWKKQLQAQRQRSNEFAGRPSQRRTDLTDWELKRQRNLQRLRGVEKEVPELVSEFFANPRLMQIRRGGLYRRGVMSPAQGESAARQIVRDLPNFIQAILATPPFDFTARKRVDGQPSEPWLYKTREELQHLGVSQEAWGDLLRHIGVQPPLIKDTDGTKPV